MDARRPAPGARDVPGDYAPSALIAPSRVAPGASTVAPVPSLSAPPPARAVSQDGSFVALICGVIRIASPQVELGKEVLKA